MNKLLQIVLRDVRRYSVATKVAVSVCCWLGAGGVPLMLSQPGIRLTVKVVCPTYRGVSGIYFPEETILWRFFMFGSLYRDFHGVHPPSFHQITNMAVRVRWTTGGFEPKLLSIDHTHITTMDD